MTWDGKERRRSERPDSQEAHDTLIRIDANLSNFMKRFEEHAEDDKTNFDNLYKRTGTLQKYLWMAFGALAAVELAVKVLK